MKMTRMAWKLFERLLASSRLCMKYVSFKRSRVEMVIDHILGFLWANCRLCTKHPCPMTFPQLRGGTLAIAITFSFTMRA